MQKPTSVASAPAPTPPRQAKTMSQVPHCVSVTVSTAVIIAGASVEVVSVLVGTRVTLKGRAIVTVDPPYTDQGN